MQAMPAWRTQPPYRLVVRRQRHGDGNSEAEAAEYQYDGRRSGRERVGQQPGEEKKSRQVREMNYPERHTQIAPVA